MQTLLVAASFLLVVVAAVALGAQETLAVALHHASLLLVLQLAVACGGVAAWERWQTCCSCPCH